MTEPLPDTWHSRDLPVLRTVVDLFDRNAGWPIRGKQVMDALGISEKELQTAIVALHDDHLLEADLGVHMPAARIKGITGEARRLANSWPSPETGVDRIIAALERIAANDPDEDQRSRAQKILDQLKGAGMQIAVGVATNVLTGQLTGS